MPEITIKVDQDVFDELNRNAAVAGVGIEELCSRIVSAAATPKTPSPADIDNMIAAMKPGDRFTAGELVAKALSLNKGQRAVSSVDSATLVPSTAAAREARRIDAQSDRLGVARVGVRPLIFEKL